MKVVIVGGHMAPALAVIESLPKDISVVYVGRKYTFEGDSGESLEYQEVKKRGLKFIFLQTGRLQRSFTLRTIPALLKIPSGFVASLRILKSEKPDVVLSFGGYLSVPIGIAAKFLGIPLVIHEQTLHAGLANRLLSGFATKICISFQSSKPYFLEKKIVFTGNPIMESKPSKEIEKELTKETSIPLLFIAGGSGGSHAINALVENILPKLLVSFRVIHQTGDAKEFGDYERLVSLKNALPDNLKKRYILKKFVDPSDVFYVFSKARIVISRAGINTISTLLMLKKPAILIPLFVGQKNEQLDNSRYYVNEVPEASVFLQNNNASQLFDEISAMIKKVKTGNNRAIKANDYGPQEKIISIIKTFQRVKTS